MYNLIRARVLRIFFSRMLMLFPLALTVSAAASDAFPGVEKLMNEAQFREAGLTRLSKQELEALNQWLVQYTAEDAETLAVTVPEIKKLKAKPIVSAIKGDFTGWTGKTIFRLENGQVWQQRNDGYFRYRKDTPAIAVIERNALGFHSLKIEGFRRKVGVKRVQ